MLTAIKALLQQEDVHNPHRRGVDLDCLVWVIRKAVLMELIEHLLHKTLYQDPEM